MDEKKTFNQIQKRFMSLLQKAVPDNPEFLRKQEETFNAVQRKYLKANGIEPALDVPGKNATPAPAAQGRSPVKAWGGGTPTFSAPAQSWPSPAMTVPKNRAGRVSTLPASSDAAQPAARMKMPDFGTETAPAGNHMAPSLPSLFSSERGGMPDFRVPEKKPGSPLSFAAPGKKQDRKTEQPRHLYRDALLRMERDRAERDQSDRDPPHQASFEFEDDIAAADSEKAPDWEPLEDFRIVTEDEKPPVLNAGGRYDEATGKTWFEDGDREVWAKTEDLQGIGVLPDGTMVGNVGTDVYALPVFEIVRARDAGEITENEAYERFSEIARQIANEKYPPYIIDPDDNIDWDFIRDDYYEERLDAFLSRTPEYYNVVDVTDRMEDIISLAEKRIRGNVDTMKEIFTNSGTPQNELKPWLMAYFRNLVSNGKDYDIKEWDEFQAHSLFVYNGEVISRDALGNILYGYLGKVCGFSDKELFRGANINQIAHGNSSLRLIITTGGDDPRDQERIREGIALFNLYYPQLDS